MTLLVTTDRAALLRRAHWLAVFTVVWNLAEGVIAMIGASTAGSRALVGFGFDSFVESISAAIVIWRLRAEQRDPDRSAQVEQRALVAIGAAFFLLAAVVAFEALRSLVGSHEPDASAIGIALTAVSLAVMPVLARAKRRVGRELESRSVEADSQQTVACVYLSAVVLVGLLLNALFGWWWADPVVALGVAGFLAREGAATLRADHVDECCG